MREFFFFIVINTFSHVYTCWINILIRLTSRVIINEYGVEKYVTNSKTVVGFVFFFFVGIRMTLLCRADVICLFFW